MLNLSSAGLQYREASVAKSVERLAKVGNQHQDLALHSLLPLRYSQLVYKVRWQRDG